MVHTRIPYIKARKRPINAPRDDYSGTTATPPVAIVWSSFWLLNQDANKTLCALCVLCVCLVVFSHNYTAFLDVDLLAQKSFLGM